MPCPKKSYVWGPGPHDYFMFNLTLTSDWRGGWIFIQTRKASCVKCNCAVHMISLRKSGVKAALASLHAESILATSTLPWNLWNVQPMSCLPLSLWWSVFFSAQCPNRAKKLSIMPAATAMMDLYVPSFKQVLQLPLNTWANRQSRIPMWGKIVPPLSLFWNCLSSILLQHVWIKTSFHINRETHRKHYALFMPIIWQLWHI